MYKRIVVKIGSNVLTRGDSSLDVTRMSAIVDQIARLRHDGIEVLLITSGAVASGRSELSDVAGRQLDSVDRRQLFSAVGQVKLINRYYELFRDYGIVIGQVLTMKESFATRRHYLNQRNCIKVMLENGVIPVINENDTVSVTELMFTDNDELSGLVATMMDADALIILSNIDGIYNGRPGDTGVEVIREVEPGKNLEGYIATGKSDFGRGGMITKYRIAQKVADEGIAVIIANGKRDNILVDLINSPGNVVSTRFIPRVNEVSSIKKWIAHSDGFTKGRIVLDARAAEAIKSESAVSILPVGVVDIEGEFEKDDLVRVVSPDGDEIGIGRTAYSSVEAREAIGRHGMKPIIHYDYLYIEQ